MGLLGSRAPRLEIVGKTDDLSVNLDQLTFLRIDTKIRVSGDCR